MKVPIEDEDEAKRVEQEAVAAPDEIKLDEPVPVDAEFTPEEEAAMVEAAKRAGQEAAEQELSSDASRLREERDSLLSQLAEAQEEAVTARQETAEAKDKFLRLQADWENYRRRTATERLSERERATEKLVVGLLPVIDDIERAIDHANATAGDAEPDGQLAQFVEGVSAVHDKLLDVLSKEGVEVIDPAGQQFDPLLHQAFGRVEDSEAYEETVAQVFQKGYRMGGKVIRTAMVTVTFGGPKRPAPEE